MTSGQPEDANKTKREQRQRRARIIFSLFMVLLGVPPLLNSLGNPRLEALHWADFLRLLASGSLMGFGVGLFSSKAFLRGG